MSGPTPKAAYPLATDGKVPFLFPRNMDLSLRGTVNHEVFCLRVSFADELKLAIDEAIKKRGLKRLALL